MTTSTSARLSTFLLALATIVGGALAQHGHDHGDHDDLDHGAPPLYEGLGDHRMPITASEDAQAFFDQGLTFVYGFDHTSAVRSFTEATRRDPACAMCHWGLALALGPHINAAMPPEAAAAAYDAIVAARRLADGVSERERAFIEALAQRYAADPIAERPALDQAYADAMRSVTEAYPDDLDAATLFAEALMVLMPWDYWASDGSPRPATVELLSVLESVMDRDPYHPGANHFYIHAVEASDRPERGEAAADRLVALDLQIGHMLHMPSHIYARVGRWHDASLANERAIEADRAHLAATEAEGLVPLLYHPHNLHFLAWTAGMEGRSQRALSAADALVDAAFDGMAHDLLLINAFLTMPVLSMVRFAAWPEILAGGPREGAHAYETAIWHYAHGRAFVATGDTDAARAQADALRAIATGPEAIAMEQPAMFFPGASMLAIAQDVLDAHLAVAGGDAVAAVASLERAVQRHDALPYFEPPHWFVSPRLDLGWLLLATGDAEGAERVFREDLVVYAENGWALHGLAESLRARGADAEAEAVQTRLDEAWRHADTGPGVGSFAHGGHAP